MKIRFSFFTLTTVAFFLFSFGLCDKAVDSVVVTFDKSNALFPSLSFTFGNATVAGTQTRTGSYTVTQIDSTIQALTVKAGTKRFFADILTCNLTTLDLTITDGDADFGSIGQAKCVAHFTGAKDLILLDDNIGAKYGKVKTISIPIPAGQITDRIKTLQAAAYPSTTTVTYELTVTTTAPVLTSVTVKAALSGSVEVK